MITDKQLARAVTYLHKAREILEKDNLDCKQHKSTNLTLKYIESAYTTCCNIETKGGK